MDGSGLAAALNEREYGILMAPAALGLAAQRFHLRSGLFLVCADVSLVGLNGAAALTKGRDIAAGLHGLTETVEHEPRRFVGDTDGPVELMG